jgi:hypothetical protein
MPTLKTFEVSFNPAKRSSSGNSWQIAMMIGKPPPRHKFEATTLQEARQTVERLAKEHGECCHASVKCIGRTPAGFNTVFDFNSLYFNTEKATAQEGQTNA